jgi:hypothetical protein
MNPIHAFLKKAARWVRYAYFLRFSLILWLFPLALSALNESGMRALTSGILTPEYWNQFLCVGFFLVSASFVALMMARVVVINGADRFQDGPPRHLKNLLANNHSLQEGRAVLVSQIPNLLTFAYLVSNGAQEGVNVIGAIVGLLLGSILAVGIWYIVNAAFYLTYRLPALPEKEVVLGKNAARTILFPRRWFWLIPPGQDFDPRTLEYAHTTPVSPLLSDKLAECGRYLRQELGISSYFYSNNRLYESHSFSAQSVLAFLCLFVALWPLTAPVPALWPSVLIAAPLLLIPSIIALVKVRRSRDVMNRPLGGWRLLFQAGIAIFLILVILLYEFSPSERFPIFALLLVMMILITWSLAAVAFFCDRYRIPVLTALFIALIVPRQLNITGGQEEHFISTAPLVTDPGSATPRLTPLATPYEILEARQKLNPHMPLIIVTATGGGLHASAWTATVLSQLEEEFSREGNKPSPTTFQEHLLLASTVSGGSVGLLSYLRNATPGFAVLPDNRRRMIRSAQCSSLEAVGWGLMYYDLPKAFLPLLPMLVSPSTGLPVNAIPWEAKSARINDLDQSPLFKDRTWALRKGFARNLNSAYCDSEEYPGTAEWWHPYPWLQLNLQTKAENEQDERSLTLEQMLGANAADARLSRPAIAINTTTVEGGSRFLLSNYKVPDSLGKNRDEKLFESYPAQSFLDLYRDSQLKGTPVDLPLATAAQMSATFPFVSSAARIPVDVNPAGLHFIDGGYYDNDGTASAIEFLRSILADPNFYPAHKATAPEQSNQDKPEDAPEPLRIILVEIRNSPDQTDDRPVPVRKLSNLFDQLMAPVDGFYKGGHESVTERNRVGLDLMLQAHERELQLKRIVLDDEESVGAVGTDPLNWSLTPAQRKEVQRSAVDCRMLGRYRQIWELLTDPGKWSSTPGEEDPNACPGK